MFANIVVTVCVLMQDGSDQCRDFTQETTATIEECREVIDAYEVHLVAQLLSRRIPVSGLNAECVLPGEPA